MTGSLPPRLALATRNPGKVREILEICEAWPVEWMVAAAGDDWPRAEETGRSYLENALLKAAVLARHLGIPSLADDSGIEVDSLAGEPGPRSARLAGEGANDAANRALLIERVREIHPQGSAARYRCVAVCAWPEGREVHAEATCEGRLILDPRGSGGFGYDPVFVPEGESRTMAELTAERKNLISHRGKAFRALRSLMEGSEGR